MIFLGTTWMRFLVNQIMLEETDLPVPFNFLEDYLLDLETLLARPSPRVFTSHLPFEYLKHLLLEDGVKVIRIFRDPKDVLVSYFHYYQAYDLLGKFSGDWNEFYELFKRKELYTGDPMDENERWWNQRYLPNMLCISYEEMKEDILKAVTRIAHFLGKDLGVDVLHSIAQKSMFSQMKQRPEYRGLLKYGDTGSFVFDRSSVFRKGQVGDWVNYFTDEQKAYIERRLYENDIIYSPRLKSRSETIPSI